MTLTIDGITYDIGIESLTRKADVLDKMAERTNDGVLHRQVIGVYYNFQLKLGSSRHCSNYDALWSHLTQPVEFHTVSLPSQGSLVTFSAYIAGVSDQAVKERNGTWYWRDLTVNFIAQSPART